jgi:hypothetical protein
MELTHKLEYGIRPEKNQIRISIYDEPGIILENISTELISALQVAIDLYNFIRDSSAVPGVVEVMKLTFYRNENLESWELKKL